MPIDGDLDLNIKVLGPALTKEKAVYAECVYLPQCAP